MDKRALEVLKELEDFGAGHGGMWNIPPEGGKFLNILAKSAGAKNILEIGTSNGYSAIWLGEAAKSVGGKVATVESSPDKVSMAKENFKRAGLDEVIAIVHGEAPAALGALPGPFDFVFIDVWNEDYVKNFRVFFPKLSAGGLIVADNAVRHSEGIEGYLQLVRNHPQLESILIPIGNGKEVSYKIK